jgi:predicted transcriptional regulator
MTIHKEAVKTAINSIRNGDSNVATVTLYRELKGKSVGIKTAYRDIQHIKSQIEKDSNSL